MNKLLLFSFILMLLILSFQGFSCTSDAGLNDTICGVEYILNADTAGLSGMIGDWSSNFPNTSFADIYDPGTSINIPNTFSLPGNPVMGTFGDTGYVNIQFYWTVTDSSCTATDTVTITFYQIPEANAGPDDAVCGKVYTMEAETCIVSSIGEWEMISGPSMIPPQYGDKFDPHTEVTVPVHGSYVFQWQESNAQNPINVCTTYDEVTINFVEIPNPMACPDQIVCGPNAYLCTGNTTFGFWSFNPTILNPSDPQPSVHYSYLSQTYTETYVWNALNISSSGIACTGKDSCDITFMVETIAEIIWDTAIHDPNVCGKTGIGIISAEPPSLSGPNISSYWTGDYLTFYPDQYTLIPDSIRSSNYGFRDCNWVVQNYYTDGTVEHYCKDSMSILLNFIEPPVAFAGLDDSVTNALNYDLQAAFSTIDTEGNWQGAIGVNAPMFYDPSDPTTNVTVLNYGTHEFIWEERSIYDASCSSVDSVKILFIEGLALSNEFQNSRIKLLQNTPNPFTTITEISFVLHKPEHITLTIYDLFGKKIKVLIDDNILQGEHKIELSGDKLKAGIYFYTLQTKTQKITRKMCNIF